MEVQMNKMNVRLGLIFAAACALIICSGTGVYADPPSYPPTDLTPDGKPTPPPPDVANAQTLLNPFAPLSLDVDVGFPELACFKRSTFVEQVKAQDGSDLVEMTHDQLMFYKGFYKGFWFNTPFVYPGYPIGETAVFAVRAVEDLRTHKAVLEGVIAIEMGDSMLCNRFPVNDQFLRLLFTAGGARVGGP
jgi:hypothetical protein